MIIKGTFDPQTRRPYCQGLLFIPGLKKQSLVDFIVDTGSDVTTLNPGDGKKMAIDYGSLRYTERCIGVGPDDHKACLKRAIVVFAAEDGTLLAYSIDLHITPNFRSAEELPSMLGTDVLSRWHIQWNPSENLLDFEPITYDRVHPRSE